MLWNRRNILSMSLHMISTIQNVLLPFSELLVMFLVSAINMETTLICMTTKMTTQEDPVKINNNGMTTKEYSVKINHCNLIQLWTCVCVWYSMFSLLYFSSFRQGCCVNFKFILTLILLTFTFASVNMSFNGPEKLKLNLAFNLDRYWIIRAIKTHIDLYRKL